MPPRSITRAVGVAACTAGLVLASAGVASAGEITGNGRLKPVQGNSLCAYSGQNDGYHIPALQHPPGIDTGRVQSYGQIVKVVGGTKGGAGRSCNPNYPPPPPPE